MKTILFILMLGQISIISFAQNQLIPDSFLGDWIGKGTLMGQNAEFNMKWESVLDGQFVRLSFENAIPDQFSFGGHAYYHIETDSTATGNWFDTRGYSFPIMASLTDDSIISNWGTIEIELGRTEYILQEDGTMMVSDYVLKDGEFKKFGEAQYQRQKAISE